MTEVKGISGAEKEATKYWGYALLLLVVVSLFFLILRFSGRSFVIVDFEILIIYMPTILCVLVYAMMIGRMVQRGAARALIQASGATW
jgi:uncharacterized membrane protein YhdT